MEHLEVVTPPVVTQTGSIIAGTSTVGGLTTSALRGALLVTGEGIPSPAYVESIDTSTQVTLTQPATETGSFPLTFALSPVTLAQARKQLRMDIVDDDEFIAGLIEAAHLRAQVLLRQTILTTTYDWFMDNFPASANGYYNRLNRMMGPNPQWLPNGAAILYIPKPPLVSVASVMYYDSTGDIQTYDPSKYFVSTGLGSRVQPVVGQVWPVIRPQIDGVVVRFTSGVANASLVPENVKGAMKMMVHHWWFNRDTTVTGTIVSGVPDAVDALLSASDHGSYS